MKPTCCTPRGEDGGTRWQGQGHVTVRTGGTRENTQQVPAAALGFKGLLDTAAVRLRQNEQAASPRPTRALRVPGPEDLS